MSEERLERLENMMADLIRMVGKNNAMVADLSQTVKDLTGKVDDLTGGFKDLTTKVNDLETKVDDLASDVKDIKREQARHSLLLEKLAARSLEQESILNVLQVIK